MRTITRRSLLRMLLGLGILNLAIPRLATAFSAPDMDNNSLARKLADSFINKESAKVVGLEYLRKNPGEADPQLLANMVCMSGRERREEFMKADNRNLRKLLQEQQRQDFANGRTFNLDGWILSETEVRLCVLAALV